MLIFTLGTLLSYTVYLPAGEQCCPVNTHPIARRYQVIGSKANPTRPVRLLPLFLFCTLSGTSSCCTACSPLVARFGVTIPAVGNRIIHRRRRHHRQHLGSRHCHNGAFLINFRIVDTVLVASIRWQMNGISDIRFSFIYAIRQLPTTLLARV
jgi:hypothetical protein